MSSCYQEFALHRLGQSVPPPGPCLCVSQEGRRGPAQPSPGARGARAGADSQRARRGRAAPVHVSGGSRRIRGCGRDRGPAPAGPASDEGAPGSSPACDPGAWCCPGTCRPPLGQGVRAGSGRVSAALVPWLAGCCEERLCTVRKYIHLQRAEHHVIDKNKYVCTPGCRQEWRSAGRPACGGTAPRRGPASRPGEVRSRHQGRAEAPGNAGCDGLRPATCRGRTPCCPSNPGHS